MVDDEISPASPDTGIAKWVYQMMLYDQWDYDGVNEHILLDQLNRRADAQKMLWRISNRNVASATRSIC